MVVGCDIVGIIKDVVTNGKGASLCIWGVCGFSVSLHDSTSSVSMSEDSSLVLSESPLSGVDGAPGTLLTGEAAGVRYTGVFKVGLYARVTTLSSIVGELQQLADRDGGAYRMQSFAEESDVSGQLQVSENIPSLPC